MLDEKNMTEDEYIKQYDMRAFAPVAVTTDLLIFTIRGGELCLLMIKRGGHPEMGKWALPGGFINTDESLYEGAARELFEETGITVGEGYLEQLKTYGNPSRDRRGYVVSTAYVALIPEIDNPEAGDDADDAHFFPVSDILEDDFICAFDHKEIIRDGLERVRAKIEYSPVALSFLSDSSFTITELRRVYEIIWGRQLNPAGFRRKILSVPGLLNATGEKQTGVSKRPSVLYTGGSVKEIYPPFRRASKELEPEKP